MTQQTKSKAAFVAFVSTLLLASLAALTLGPQAASADDLKPIQIAEVKRDAPVDFEKDILNPILRRNCLACHNATDAESDLVLESPAAILKGGSEGPAAIAGKGAESLLLKISAHQMEPVMPPADNDVGAKNLTPEELGLIKLWIDQGAKGEVSGAGQKVVFEKLPPGVNPIYAVAVSPDGHYAAAGRANQIFIYHVPSKREVARLTDPALLKSGIYEKPGIAHLDLVQALKFSPNNRTLASSGYKTVKLWQRPENVQRAQLAGLESPPRSLAVSADGKWAAIGEEGGKIKLFDLSTNKVAKTLQGHTASVNALQFSADGAQLVSGSKDKSVRIWKLADGSEALRIDTAHEISALTLFKGGTQIATGGSDNQIRLWTLVPDMPATEGLVLAGHSKPVTSLATVNDTQILSGAMDNTVRHWNTDNGKAIRSMNHGGPVLGVAVRGDAKRFASVSNNNTAKLWDGANGKQIAELKGDFRSQLNVGDWTRTVALAKRKVDDTKKDLDEANKRKKAEEDNAKKSAEAVKKAEEEHKKKVEAAKKPIADKEAADKALVTANAELPKAEAAKKAAEATQKADTDALTKAQAAAKVAAKAATDAATALQQAQAKLKAAQAAAAADAGNADKAAAVTAAQKVVTDAEANKKKADEAKVAGDKVALDAGTKKKASDTAKTAADKAFTAATAKQKAADAAAKKAVAPAQKAIDERTAAERALNASKRSVTRAGESVKKATAAIPPVEAAIKAAEAEHTQKTQSLEAAKKADTEALKPLAAIAFSADGGTVATAGDDSLVHTWDSETGAPIDVFTGQGAAIHGLAFLPSGDLLSTAQNNSAVLWNTNPDWSLARTIGSMDTADFSDRVTSLAFSPDGKHLATGGGEPSRSGQLKIFNVEDGKLVQEIKEPHSDTIFAMEYSPDAKYLATCAADRFVKVFTLADGTNKSFEGHTHHVLGVSWRADGRVLASSGADKVIKVWDFRTGDQKRTITGFQKEMTAIQFVVSANGTNIVNIVASSGDKNVYTRNSDNGGGGPTFSGGTDFMYSVDVAADGNTVVAGGQDSVLRIWRANAQLVVIFEPPKPADQTAAVEGGK